MPITITGIENDTQHSQVAPYTTQEFPMAIVGIKNDTQHSQINPRKAPEEHPQ